MFSEKIHRYIFLFGLFSLGFGMMVGTVPTSVPQIILMANWLLELDFKRKWQWLKNNKLFWVLGSVYFIHVLGLLYSQNLDDGLKDIRTKIPLLFLPMLLFSSKPLSLKEVHGLLYCFIAGCLVNTGWCLVYSFVLHKNEVVRNASRFMSHIRLGLYINIAITVCVYFTLKSKDYLKKTGYILLVLYFAFVLYALGLASGIINFILLFLLVLSAVIYKQGILVKLLALIIVVLFCSLVYNYILNVKKHQLNIHSSPNNELQVTSPSGRPYTHFTENTQVENGNRIHINIQLEEIQREWKREFPEDSFNYATHHNLQRYVVLVRYLSSKGLNKDSAAMAKLDSKDKINIKNNVVNYEYPGWSFLHKRTYELINEYDEFVNKRVINGHSLTMRLYFWQAALQIIKTQPLFGVGTGDVQQELNKMYISTNSPLEPEWYKRPHNQFLTIAVALGITGLLIFLISLIYPIVTLKNDLPKLYFPFFIIAFLSFFLEDTLETQAGLSFYAFFNTFFISIAWHKKHKA